MTFHYVPSSELKLPPPIETKLRTLLTDFELLQPYLIISVVCVWCTHHKVQGILYLEFNAIGPCIKSSTVRCLNSHSKSRKATNFPFLACLVILDIDCKAQGLVSYSLLIVTLFISYIRGKSSPQLNRDHCLHNVLCLFYTVLLL